MTKEGKEKMAKFKLITEQSFDIEIYEDTKKGDNLYIVGLFSSAGIENANKRKYPRDILEREIKRFTDDKIKNKSALGQLNHPSSPETDLEKAAILIESLEWKGDNVYGRAKILSTPAGMTAKSLIKDGVKLGISSRGLGNVSEDGVVEESYQLITYDLVSNPSTPGGWVNGIYEAKTFDVDIPKEEKKVDEKELKEELKKAQDKRFKEVMEKVQSWANFRSSWPQKDGKSDPEPSDTTDAKKVGKARQGSDKWAEKKGKKDPEHHDTTDAKAVSKKRMAGALVK